MNEKKPSFRKGLYWQEMLICSEPDRRHEYCTTCYNCYKGYLKIMNRNAFNFCAIVITFYRFLDTSIVVSIRWLCFSYGFIPSTGSLYWSSVLVPASLLVIIVSSISFSNHSDVSLVNDYHALIMLRIVYTVISNFEFFSDIRSSRYTTISSQLRYK